MHEEHCIFFVDEHLVFLQNSSRPIMLLNKKYVLKAFNFAKLTNNSRHLMLFSYFYKIIFSIKLFLSLGVLGKRWLIAEVTKSVKTSSSSIEWSLIVMRVVVDWSKAGFPNVLCIVLHLSLFKIFISLMMTAKKCSCSLSTKLLV